MDNHRRNVQLVQEAVGRKCADLEHDPYLVQRVLNAAEEKEKARKPEKRKGFSVSLAFALVLMMVGAVAISLVRGQERMPLVVAASQPEDDEQGFTNVNVSKPLLPASGHTCKYHLHIANPGCYRYADEEHDILSVEFIAVCDICGKTNGLSYAPQFRMYGPYSDEEYLAEIEKKLSDHEWVVDDRHIEGTDLHEFTRVCTKCRTRWVPVEVNCPGGDTHVDASDVNLWAQDESADGVEGEAHE